MPKLYKPYKSGDAFVKKSFSRIEVSERAKNFIVYTQNGQGYLYSNVSIDDFISAYLKYIKSIRFDKEIDALSGQIVWVTEDELFLIKQEIILTSFIFCDRDKKQFSIKKDDLYNQQGKRTVRYWAEKKYGINTEKAFIIGALLLNLSIEDYRAWCAGDDAFSSR